MNSEKYIQKKQEQANVINEKVDEFYVAHPKSKKSENTVAEETIKEEAVSYLPLSRIPDEHKAWFQNIRSAGVKVLEGGFLEISRWDNTGQHIQKPKRLGQKVDGINSALRMQDHILGGYRNEKIEGNDEYSKLESIEEVIEYANELLTNWENADQTTREELQQQLADVVLQLEKCRNEFKIETKDQAEAVMKLKDSRGRENPSALAARTIAALNRLTERINQMQLISPRIALRKEVLTLEKRRMQVALRRSDAALSGILHHVVFSQKLKASPETRIRDYEVEILNQKLGQVIHQLDTVYIAPYHQQAEQAKFFLTDVAQNFFTNKQTLVENIPKIREELLKVQDILKSNVEDFG